MSDNWLRRFAWGLAVYSTVVLLISAIWLFSAADSSSVNWLWIQVSTIVGIGAPILGLIIIRKRPHQRVGWLWLIIGLLFSFRALGYAVFYGGGSQSAGYSSIEYFLLWSTEAANFTLLVCQVLLLLWFPDGKLVSNRWRILYAALAIALLLAFSGLFVVGTNWNGSEEGGGIVIDNPYGFINLDAFFFGLPAFLIIVIITLLAAVSLMLRYRSAIRLVRYQIRWFIVGVFFFIIMDYMPLFFMGDIEILTNRSRLLYAIAFSKFVPLYLAIGFAISRYRLYDIDVVIRKTLVYTILTGLLGLAYFGSVLLLQTIFETFTQESSPIIIVLSTLFIAALFGTLRKRVQAFIDRNFYRQRYDAQKILAQFAQTARDEVEMEVLQAELLRVVQETLQPESLVVWLKEPRS